MIRHAYFFLLILFFCISYTHREYPIDTEILIPQDELMPLSETDFSQETNIPSALTPEPVSATQSTESESALIQKNECTNSKIRALITGYCIGTAMGIASYHSHIPFPGNWIVDFFMRILLVDAAVNPCTQKNIWLMQESAWVADWLAYSYFWLYKPLHAWHFI